MRLKEVDRLDAMVDCVAREMKKKLRMKHQDGLRGWERNVDVLLDKLDRNMAQKDYLDVCCLSAMLFHFQFRNRSQGVTWKEVQANRKAAQRRMG